MMLLDKAHCLLDAMEGVVASEDVAPQVARKNILGCFTISKRATFGL